MGCEKKYRERMIIDETKRSVIILCIILTSKCASSLEMDPIKKKETKSKKNVLFRFEYFFFILDPRP